MPTKDVSGSMRSGFDANTTPDTFRFATFSYTIAGRASGKVGQEQERAEERSRFAERFHDKAPGS
jgi:hypothetical protein